MSGAPDSSSSDPKPSAASGGADRTADVGRSNGRLALPTSRWWQWIRGDLSLSLFLISLIGYMFMLAPLVPEHSVGRAVLDVFFFLMLLTAVFSVADHRHLRWTASLLFGLALLVRGGFRAVPTNTAQALSYGTAVLFIIFIGLCLLTQVFRDGPVNAHRIRGAIAVYLLFGLGWGLSYGVVDVLFEGAFLGVSGAPGDESRLVTLVYFSFVTLTSLGYGDVVPLHGVARNLAILEALTGQLYMAIVIARLVALAITDARMRPPELPEEDR